MAKCTKYISICRCKQKLLQHGIASWFDCQYGGPQHCGSITSALTCRLILDSHVAIALTNHLVEICSSGVSSRDSMKEGDVSCVKGQEKGNWLLNQQVGDAMLQKM